MSPDKCSSMSIWKLLVLSKERQEQESAFKKVCNLCAPLKTPASAVVG